MDAHKVVLVGDAGVGKTCLCDAIQKRDFKAQPSTIAALYHTIRLPTKRGMTREDVWDTAGQEQYRQLVPIYLRNAAVALMCFSMGDEATLYGMQKWRDLLHEAPGGTNTVIALVGCKGDLSHAVQTQEIQKMGDLIGAQYVCVTSSFTGEGVDDLSQWMGDTLEMGEEGASGVVLNAPAPRTCGC